MYAVKKITNGMEKRYWAYTFLAPLTMIGEVIMETLIPYFMALIVDKGIASKDILYTSKIGGIMVLCAVFSLLCGAGGALFGALASQGFSRNLRRNLFAKIQDFSFFNIDKFTTASLVTRLTTDVTNVQNVYQLLVRVCVRAPFMLIAGTVMAFLINAKLAFVFVLASPVLACAILFISKAAYAKFAVMLEKYDKMNSVVQENLIAIRVVKAFVRSNFEKEKFNNAAEAVRNAQLRAERLVIRLMPINQLVVYACLIAVFWFGGKMVVFGSMKAGELISFLSYVTQILMSIMMLGMIFVNLVLSRASVTRILEVFDEELDVVSPKENAIETVSSGEIEFKNVCFSYSKKVRKDVLTDISLKIPSGSTVGIIGGTGSSKSTLVSLIPRLYDVTSGTVLVGGFDVKRYSLTALRDAVSVVLQKNVLFSGTIKENLLWGNENALDSQLQEACDSSCASEFIKTFAEGLETQLGQGGVNLSGGQKQRLCIARALLKKPKILILDDSTSAVDTKTESFIRKALKNNLPETTKIIIAQRISSVKDADIIFVLDDGKISGIGSHEKLLKENKIYQEVYESQQTMGDADI